MDNSLEKGVTTIFPTPGLNKLNQTEVEVKQLQIELADLKPLMEKAAEETRKVIDRIAIDSVSFFLTDFYSSIGNIYLSFEFSCYRQ